VRGCANCICAINEECALLVIKQACTTLINDETARQRTKGGEDCGAALFTKLDTGEKASPTDRVCRLRQRTLLQGCSTRFKCGESTGERPRLCLCSASRTFTLSNGCSSGGGTRFSLCEFACRGGKACRGIACSGRGENQNVLCGGRVFVHAICGNGGALCLKSLKTGGEICALYLA
jgi:hypothetical protein